ncbi:MAG TPA: LPS export ABC transporter permease LptF [Gammaproteobacteria bacterium]|nr:LPS export ABC transporter permease LptF [Gammaproteobacteria bacterium]
MIIDRYVAREILLTLVGVTIVLLLILFSARLVAILADAASGNLPVNYIMVLLALRNISNLVTVLPLALFLAVLLALSRMYIDNEMTVLAACGIGVGRIVRTVLVFAVVMAVVVGFLSLYAAPWAEFHSQRLMDQGAAESEVYGITAGSFHDIGGGGGVMYAQGISDDRQDLHNVFLQSDAERHSVISAAAGRRYRDPRTGARYLEVEDGYRYDGHPGEKDYIVTRFKKQGVRIREPAVTPTSTMRKAMTTRALWRAGGPSNLAEIQGRISDGLWVIVLALIAVPLSYTSPRQGRYAKIFSAILIYIIYSNFLGVARSWIEKGELSPVIGLWWVHVLLLLFALALLGVRSGGRLNLRWTRR